MEALQKKIKALMDSPDPILEELDLNELNYISDLMDELNRTGRYHSINKITHNDKVLEVEANYKIAFIKK